jgi:hypothetical protein
MGSPAMVGSAGLSPWALREHLLNCPNDPSISGASTKVPTEFKTNSVLVCTRQPQYDVARRDEHPRGAISALQRMLGGERGTQAGHDRILIESFDTSNLTANAGCRVRDTRA